MSRARLRIGSVSASGTLAISSASRNASKKSTSLPVSPCVMTSSTGAVVEATTAHPHDIASSTDHESMKGYVR